MPAGSDGAHMCALFVSGGLISVLAALGDSTNYGPTHTCGSHLEPELDDDSLFLLPHPERERSRYHGS